VFKEPSWLLAIEALERICAASSLEMPNLDCMFCDSELIQAALLL
jgi:hypothetical protein